MKYITILITSVLLSFSAFAQQTFQTTLGLGTGMLEVGYAVKPTADAGFIVVGVTDYSVSQGEILVLKLDSVGDTLWTQILGGGFEDKAYDVIETSDGGYMVVGQGQSTPGNGDIYVHKLNSSGVKEWASNYGAMGGNEVANSVIESPNGGYVLAGYTLMGLGGQDGYLIRINEVGDTLWTKTYGGLSLDYFESISLCSDGGFIMSGSTGSFGGQNAYVIRTDSVGDTLWTKQLGGLSVDYGTDVEQTTDGGYIVSGYSFSYGLGDADFSLTKLNANGSLAWYKTYGTGMDDRAYAVAQTPDGGYITTGHTWDPGAALVLIVKTDALGDTLWTKMYGDDMGENYSYDIQVVPSGGYVVTGIFIDILGGNEEVYVLKLDNNGNTVGCKRYNGSITPMTHTPSVDDFTPTTISSDTNSVYDVGSYSINPFQSNQWVLNKSMMTLSFNFTTPSCVGASDGTATAVPACGIAPYSYLWSNSGATDTINGVAGYYSVTVTDANGNTAVDSVNVLDPIALTAMPSFTNFTYCDSACTGIAESMTSGGSAPYTYAWSNGETTFEADSLCLGMSYITVTDGNGCTVTDSIDIMADPASNFQPNIGITNQPACSTACNAILWVDGQGVAPYTFLWDDPAAQTTDTVKGLCVGTHVVKVWDAQGCIAFDTLSITAAGDTMGLAMVGGDRSCNVWCDGSATAGISGNIPGPFVYTWNDPQNQTTQTADSLCAGTYTLTFTDTNGCFSLTDSVIISDAIMSLSLFFSTQDASCAGVCDGLALVLDGGGMPADNWLWDDPAAQTNQTATGLCSGTYTVIVSEPSGCTQDTASAVVSDIVPTISLTMDSVNVICNGICDGITSVSAAATYPPVSYLWNDPSTQTSDTAIGLCPGTYTVSVTDSLGCMTVMDSVTVGTDPFTPEPICVISVDSTSSKNVIVWEKPATAGIDSIRIYRDIIGTYTHVGSVPYSAISFYEDTMSGINPSTTSYRYKISTIDTCGAESALSGFHKTIHLQVVPGVPPAMQLSWDDYEGFSFTFYRILRDTTGLDMWEKIDSTSFGINSLTDPNPPQTGNLRYIVEVVAPATCVATKQKSFNSSKSNTTFTSTGPVLGLTANTTSATSGNCDGSATALPTGGLSPYAYSWNTSPVQTTATATGLCGNTGYNIIVTDALGDTISTSVFISELSSTLGVTVSATDASFGICNASAVATATGGTSPYTYSWNTSPIQTNATAFGLCGNTTYSVLITDANGDTISTSVLVPELTSIDDQLLNQLFEVYPNPNTGSFTIDLKLPGSDKWSLRIFNILGNEIQYEYLGVVNGNLLKAVELPDAATGIYYVQLSNGKVSLRKKVVLY